MGVRGGHKARSVPTRRLHDEEKRKEMFLVLPLSRCFGWQERKKEEGGQVTKALPWNEAHEAPQRVKWISAEQIASSAKTYLASALVRTHSRVTWFQAARRLLSVQPTGCFGKRGDAIFELENFRLLGSFVGNFRKTEFTLFLEEHGRWTHRLSSSFHSRFHGETMYEFGLGMSLGFYRSILSCRNWLEGL